MTLYQLDNNAFMRKNRAYIIKVSKIFVYLFA